MPRYGYRVTGTSDDAEHPDPYLSQGEARDALDDGEGGVRFTDDAVHHRVTAYDKSNNVVGVIDRVELTDEDVERLGKEEEETPKPRAKNKKR